MQKITALHNLRKLGFNTPNNYYLLEEIISSNKKHFFLRSNKKFNLNSKIISRDELIENWKTYHELLISNKLESIEDKINPQFGGIFLLQNDLLFAECIFGHPRKLLNENKYNIRVLKYVSSDKFIHLSNNLKQDTCNFILNKIRKEISIIAHSCFLGRALIEWAYDEDSGNFIYFDLKTDYYIELIKISLVISEDNLYRISFNNKFDRKIAYLSHESLNNFKYETRNRGQNTN